MQSKEYGEGYEAFFSKESCPYEPLSQQWLDWFEGYGEAEYFNGYPA